MYARVCVYIRVCESKLCVSRLHVVCILCILCVIILCVSCVYKWAIFNIFNNAYKTPAGTTEIVPQGVPDEDCCLIIVVPAGVL